MDLNLLRTGQFICYKTGQIYLLLTLKMVLGEPKFGNQIDHFEKQG